jgi:hypothetical protein
VVTETDYVPHADDNDSFENIDNDNDYYAANTTDYDDDSEHHLSISLVNAFRAPHELRNLPDFLYNPLSPDALQAPLPPPNNKSALLATVYDGNPEPKHYLEARTSPDLSNWKARKFGNIIGARRVYAKKVDGGYCARCVAKGFSQIPGKDF